MLVAAPSGIDDGPSPRGCGPSRLDGRRGSSPPRRLARLRPRSAISGVSVATATRPMPALRRPGASTCTIIGSPSDIERAACRAGVSAAMRAGISTRVRRLGPSCHAQRPGSCADFPTGVKRSEFGATFIRIAPLARKASIVSARLGGHAKVIPGSLPAEVNVVSNSRRSLRPGTMDSFEVNKILGAVLFPRRAGRWGSLPSRRRCFRPGIPRSRV